MPSKIYLIKDKLVFFIFLYYHILIMTITKYVLLAFLIFTISLTMGCQTTKAPSKPYQTWTPPKQEKISKTTDPTWSAIRKKEFDTSQPFTLVELIDIALSNNPATRQAWKQAHAAEAGVKQAKSTLYPQVTVSADATRHKTVTKQKISDLDELEYGPAAKFTYLLLDFGGRGAQIKEASKMLLAANFQFNQSIQDLLLEVEKAYYGLYSDQAILEAAKIDLKNTKEVLEATKQKFDSGLVSKLDVLQAKSNYEDALYSLGDAEGAVKNSKADLAQILGLAADTPLQIAAPHKEIPTDITVKDVSQLIDETLMKKPSVASLRAGLQAKEEAVKSANSDLWPTLGVGASTEKNWHRQHGPVKAHTTDYELAGSLSVTWDIFDGFYNLSKKRQLQAEADAERENLKQAQLQASTDVWTKYSDYRTAVKKYEYAKVFFDTTNASYDMAMESYNAGLKSILDLLQAQSDLSKAQSQLIQSREDLFVGLADLAHAAGLLSIKKDSITGKWEVKTDVSK